MFLLENKKSMEEKGKCMCVTEFESRATLDGTRFGASKNELFQLHSYFTTLLKINVPYVLIFYL